MEVKHARRRKGNANVDISNLVYGKVPPQAIELEKAVLGAIMLEKNAIDIATEILSPESFYLDAHQRIYKAVLSLDIKNQAIDIATVTQALEQSGELPLVGGPYYVTQLTNNVVSSAHIERHCQIVKERHTARGIINLSGETLVKTYEGEDIFEIIENHERQMSEIIAGVMGKAFSGMDECLEEALAALEHRRNNSDVMSGIPSGFTELDRITNGWQNSTLVILAARPAVGKTALALQMAYHAAMNHIKPVPVAFFSLEMPRKEITNRCLSRESEVSLSSIIKGTCTNDDMRLIYSKAVQKMLKAKVFIDDSGGLTLQQLRSKLRKQKRKWKREFGTDEGIAFIDYLQLMSGSGGKGNREQEISEISRGLKQLAKELEIPIIALSQLSRQVDNRKGESKVPVLSDLRESGAIEQDADMVLFIYRPEYYDINTNEQGESTKGETHIKIAKHRAGELGLVKLRAELAIQKFTTWEDEWGPKTFSIAPVNSWHDSPKDNRTDDECPF